MDYLQLWNSHSLPGDTWQQPESLLTVTSEQVYNTIGIWWAEARDAASHSTMHRRASSTSINSAKAAKPAPRHTSKWVSLVLSVSFSATFPCYRYYANSTRRVGIMKTHFLSSKDFNSPLLFVAGTLKEKYLFSKEACLLCMTVISLIFHCFYSLFFLETLRCSPM